MLEEKREGRGSSKTVGDGIFSADGAKKGGGANVFRFAQRSVDVFEFCFGTV